MLLRFVLVLCTFGDTVVFLRLTRRLLVIGFVQGRRRVVLAQERVNLDRTVRANDMHPVGSLRQ